MGQHQRVLKLQTDETGWDNEYEELRNQAFDRRSPGIVESLWSLLSEVLIKTTLKRKFRLLSFLISVLMFTCLGSSWLGGVSGVDLAVADNSSLQRRKLYRRHLL